MAIYTREHNGKELIVYQIGVFIPMDEITDLERLDYINDRVLGIYFAATEEWPEIRTDGIFEVVTPSGDHIESFFEMAERSVPIISKDPDDFGVETIQSVHIYTDMENLLFAQAIYLKSAYTFQKHTTFEILANPDEQKDLNKRLWKYNNLDPRIKKKIIKNVEENKQRAIDKQHKRTFVRI